MYRSKKRQEEAKKTLKSLRKRETEEDDGNTEEAGTSLLQQPLQPQRVAENGEKGTKAPIHRESHSALIETCKSSREISLSTHRFSKMQGLFINILRERIYTRCF